MRMTAEDEKKKSRIEPIKFELTGHIEGQKSEGAKSCG
jgi:hypothetical protein